MPDATTICQKIAENISTAFIGKPSVIAQLLVAVVCRGHILLEDVPGVGKTSLVTALARSLDLQFTRIQCTPDTMPSDITGFCMPHPQTGVFTYQPGAVMTQILLVDEINRTSPKTQSALLQVMQEGTVSIDGTTHRVPEPFIVLATQNPVEFSGTYPLPEAQLDRFFMRLHLGYPSPENELELLRRFRTGKSPGNLRAVCTAGDITALQAAVDDITVTDVLNNYVITVVSATREHPDVLLGISPRGSLALLQAACGLALLHGRSYVLPDDVQAMTLPVLSHRLQLTPEAHLRGATTESVL
ncbi:MAG: MoxR family ATPase, partial [Clostridia bacterium]|nr:MoxR family ATPase [Clostridia bacterium]